VDWTEIWRVDADGLNLGFPQKNFEKNYFEKSFFFFLEVIQNIFLLNFTGLLNCPPAIMQPFPSASERQIKV
jgi:hypothetical protein